MCIRDRSKRHPRPRSRRSLTARAEGPAVECRSRRRPRSSGRIVIVVDASVLAPALADDTSDGDAARLGLRGHALAAPELIDLEVCLLYTSDAADDLTRVDLGGRRIIK